MSVSFYAQTMDVLELFCQGSFMKDVTVKSTCDPRASPLCTKLAFFVNDLDNVVLGLS